MTGVPLVVPTPVETARFSYWPARATLAAEYRNVSPGSSRALPLASPPVKVGMKSSAGTPGVPASSTSVTFRSGSLPGLVTL